MLGEPWRIEMLGGLCALQGTRRVERFRTAKTGLLLAYLACSQRARNRGELTEFLWPDGDPIASRNNLSQSLSSLRHQLEPPGVAPGSVLIADRAAVRLRPEAFETDVAEFERLTRATDQIEALTGAVALYRGDFLPGYYEDWALAEQDRLRELYVRSRMRLAEMHVMRGESDLALEAARAAHEADPLNEAAVRLVISILRSGGRNTEAQRFFARFEERLADEVSARPEAETLRVAGPISVDGVKRSRETTRCPRPQPVSAAPQEASQQQQARPGTGSLARTRIPAVFSSFVGRELELAALRGLLVPGPSGASARLVTLAGPGGTGKTRLALEAARTLGAELGGEAWFVPLAAVSQPSDVPAAVRDALGLEARPDTAAAEQSIAFLAEKRGLVVLDNLEQLLDSPELPSFVRTLLERAPGLAVLATSRRPLGLAGEREFPVPPLPLPEAHNDLIALAAVPSIRLFVERAQEVCPHFQLTAGNAGTLAELCHRLEGMPLAIELAAARAGVLGPSQILARLGDRLGFLADRRRHSEERHQSLRAAIDWSYRLLPPDLQRAFIRLSVFRGGWTLAAAECVIGSSDGLHGPDPLDQLAALRECSLVEWANADASAEPRFRMLETIREFAEAHLPQAEREDAQRCHAEHFASVADAAGQSLAGSNQMRWGAAIDLELENLRASIDWSIQSGATSLGLRITAGLCRYWLLRGHASEMVAAMSRLMPPAADDSAASILGFPLLAASHHALGAMASQLGDYHAADAHFLAGFAASGQSGDPAAEVRAMEDLGTLAFDRGRYADARRWYERALPMASALPDPGALAGVLNSLGVLACEEGRYPEAITAYERSLEIRRQAGDRRGEAALLNNLGIVARRQGDLATAQEHYEQSLVLRRLMGDRRGVAGSLSNLGIVLLARGNAAEAEALHREALAMREVVGDRWGIAVSHACIGHARLAQGNAPEALFHQREGLRIRHSLGDARGTALSLEGVAEVDAEQGRAQRALRALGAASALRERVGAAASPSDQNELDALIGRCRAVLDPAKADAAWSQGSLEPLDEAVRAALGMGRATA